MKSVAFKTLGCRLNQAESAALAGQLEALGYEATTDTESADILVVHSCAITRAAEQDSLRVLRHAKRRPHPPFVVFAGCATTVAQADRLRAEGADLIVAQAEKDTLPARLAAALGDPATPPSTALPRFGTTRALVKVQDGCDFRCAYCIVPDARGRPRSRPASEVLAEVAGLAETGFREFVLTGVNVGCYHDGSMGLPGLIQALASLPGVLRLRLSSIEPGTAERDIADLAVAESKLCRTLHLPLQSGDARILRSMRRRYTPAQYEDSVRHALARLPLLGLGADVITGFPGEDDAAFEATRQLVARLPFSNLHVFPYSERPGTPAAELPGTVPVAVRRARARELLALGQAQREAFAQRFVGRAVDVLVERVDADGVGRGWTGEYLEARIPGLAPQAVGTVVRFTPTTATGQWLA